MTKKEVKKRTTSKSRKTVNSKTSKKTPLREKNKGKTAKVRTLKKVKAIKKVAKKVRSKEKAQKAEKVRAPKKVTITKRVKVVKGVKTSKRVVTPVKVKTRQPGTAVIIDKKSEEQRSAALKSALIKKREEIVREAKREISKYIRGETKQLVDTALDNGDWSVVDLSEDISLRQLSTHNETLLKIDEAIRKIDEGTYGKCEDCGEGISVERLKVLPFAIYCVDCQERREQRAVLEKGESAVE